MKFHVSTNFNPIREPMEIIFQNNNYRSDGRNWGGEYTKFIWFLLADSRRRDPNRADPSDNRDGSFESTH